MTTLVNGKRSVSVADNDRGLLYGDGLFETIAVFDAQPHQWDRHMKRLKGSCERLMLPLPDPDRLLSEVHELCRNEPRAVIKIIVTRGLGQRGYGILGAGKPTRIVQLHPWPNYPEDFYRHGVVARWCHTRLSINPILAGIKHLNRLEQVLARSEWQDSDVFEGLMLDIQGHVVSGVMSNLFMVHDQTLLTPTVELCGVAGVQREHIIAIAGTLQIPLEIGRYTPEHVFNADELFICNSLIGIVAINQIDKRRYTIGPIIHRLQEHLGEMP